MARGGKRENAGRKKSALTRRTRQVAEQIVLDGQETPLEYMLRVMRTSNDDKRCDAMAIAAASYIHPKLAAVEHSGDAEKPLAVQIVSGVPREEFEEESANGHDLNGEAHTNH